MHLRFVCVRVCAILRPTDTDSYFAIVIVYLPIGTLIIAKKALANDGPEQLYLVPVRFGDSESRDEVIARA